MIKFFRNIRQKLIKQGKTTNYLKYAIGEIVLVVIGILIALSINTWNENRKNQLRKEKLLNALKIEFTSNKIQLDTVLYYDNKVLCGVQRLLKVDPENPIEMANDSMAIWLQNSSYRWTFDPINGALRSGISSGEIHVIKSDSLVDLLFGWQDVVADAKENEVRCIEAVIDAKSVIEKHVRTLDYRYILFPELNTSRFQSDYTSLLRDPMFEDYLGERYIAMKDAVNELNLVKTQNELILDLIDSELNAHKHD
jgi:hypothetical protein